MPFGDSSTLGTVFTGNIPYDTNKVMYGPFEFPVIDSMQLYVGYTPTSVPMSAKEDSVHPVIHLYQIHLI
ncbi:MAG: hypothetical protein R2847_11785 [Bacteroidia bacterium]